MKCSLTTVKCLGLCLTLLPLLQQEASALAFSNDNMDAMLCFRKQSAPNPFDLEVDLGPVTNFANLPIGTVTNLTQHFYTTNQLLDAIGTSTFDLVEFSVNAAAQDNTHTYPYALDTCFFTFGRVVSSVQTTPFARGGKASLGLAASPIAGIGNLATSYSGSVATGANNTATAVEVPPGSADSCEVNLGSGGNLKGQAPVVVENRAPSPFTSAIVSDFYIDVPNNQPDPFNGNATTGNASYLGFFTFTPDGTVTFTRQSVAPKPPTLTIAKLGLNTYGISFASSNSVTYTLAFTNTAGLGNPVSTWPTVNTNITGDGTVKTFFNVSTDPNRVYVVKAH